MRTRADLGRLGGLLKMWLTNEDEHVVDIRALLDDIEQGQREVRSAGKEILKAVKR